MLRSILEGKEKNNMSATFDEKKLDVRYEQARERVERMGFSPDEINFIFQDWANWNDHLNWLIDEDVAEIRDWVDSCYTQYKNETTEEV
jgi:hypothetical protein